MAQHAIELILMRQLAGGLATPVFLVDPDGDLLFYNEPAEAILGCRYGTARPRRDFPMLAALYLAGRLRIDELITARYALEDFGRALADLQRGDLARGVFSLG